MIMARVSFKKTQAVCEEMQAQRDGFFHLMCIELQADEVSYLNYNGSRLAMYLEHASVDAFCFDSTKKRTYSFECKNVSAERAPNVTLELSHQNGKVGWALDECTMNKYIVFFLEGVGAVMCHMKTFQDAVKKGHDEWDDAFFYGKHNGSRIIKVHYDWLIEKAGGKFYPEEKLLHAEKVQRDMQARRLLSTINEPGSDSFKYTVAGMVEMVCTDRMGIKKRQTIGSSLASSMVCCMAISTAYNAVYFLIH
ncbi:hypothetical protein [Brevibacillus sp. H7]|uniref:hypothetical protein n=1 Tax=Brevibacillus sp. H7 TaxID=3349138 RepID=UPI0038080F12